MSKTIAVINQKGGVGKTAIAYNLAYSLSSKSIKTMLVDMDPSANASKGLDINYSVDRTIKHLLLDKSVEVNDIRYDYSSHLTLIPSHITLAAAARQISTKPYRESLLAKKLRTSDVQSEFEYIFIDCSPTLSDLTVNVIYAADIILIPIRYEEDALEGVSDLFEIIREIKEDKKYIFKILRNGKDERKKIVNEYIEDLLKPFIEQGHVLNTIVRQDEDFNKAKISRKPVSVFSPNSNADKNMITLREELLNV